MELSSSYMDETVTTLLLRSLRRFKRGTTPDYKQRLKREAVPAHQPLCANTPPLSITEGLRALASDAQVHSTAFQGVVQVALQSLHQVRHYEQRASGAAISLAQRLKLQRMVEVVDATIQTLQELLHRSGARALDQRRSAPPDQAPESSWWFSLCEAMHVLEQSASYIHTIAVGQSMGTATHMLTGLVASLLLHHYQAVEAEAEQWMA
jgi:hypothetical protein